MTEKSDSLLSDSLLPESVRNHPTLIRLRASLLALAPDKALLELEGLDVVASALALSHLAQGPDLSD